MTVTDSLIERVRKLLNTKGRSPEEAAAFVARAMEIVHKHNLDLAAVESEPERFGREIIDDAVNATWREILIAATSEAFDCKTIRVGSWGLGSFHVLGEKHNLEVVKFTYTYLSREVDRLAGIYWTVARLRGEARTYEKRAWLRSFRLGAVHAIDVRLTNTKKEQTEAAPAAERAIVASHDAALARWVEQQYPDLKSSGQRGKIKVDGGALRTGVEAGGRIAINKAVGEAHQQAGRLTLGSGAA